MKISLWKKIKLYFVYKKIVKQASFLLQNETNLRLDKVGRLYTVLNVNVEDIKNYGPKLSAQIIQKYVNDYIATVDKAFFQIGLTELVGLLDIKKLDETNYLIIFGYSFLNTKRIANIILTVGITAILAILYLLFFKFL
jgi:hypothetical protein